MSNPTNATAKSARPHGRSIKDFRDQHTESGLLPAEDKLVIAVAKGELCDLTVADVATTFCADLDKALQDLDVLGLATEVIANCRQIRLTNEAEKDGRTNYEDALVGLDGRIARQSHIARDFLTALPGFTETRTLAELGAGAGANQDVLAAVLPDLRDRFKCELAHWRTVDPSSAVVRVRADFLRFLALGGDSAVSVHEKGIRLKGGYIDGELDLTACDDVSPLDFADCLFSKSISFPGARLRRLSLSGSCVPAVHGVRCRTENDVYLDDGFRSAGPVCLIGAAIGGSLDCRGGLLYGGLDCATSKISGDVFLSPHFEAYGEVAFAASEISGTLYCAGGTFFNRTPDGRGKAFNGDAAKIGGSVSMRSIRAEGRVFLMGIEIGYSLEPHGARIYNHMPKRRQPALQCQGAKVGGNILLCDGSNINGGAGFAGAKIGGTLDCSGATFSNLLAREFSSSGGKIPVVADHALDLANVVITEEFRLRQHEGSGNSVPGKVRGSVDLTGAHTKMLVDHPDAWPEKVDNGLDGQQLSCEIKLDGFTYDRFAQGAPTEAKHRLVWLSLQPPEHLSSDFRPQPFEQLVKVLREMGHEANARKVAIAKLRNRRRAKCDAILGGFSNWPSGRREWALRPIEIAGSLWAGIGLFFEWLIVDVILGNGYSKVRPVLFFLLILFGCAGFYSLAAKKSAFVPTNPLIYKDPAVRQACVEATPDVATPVDWYACKKMPFELNPFRPLAYSLDQMIPFLQLGQKRDWQPVSIPLVFNPWGIGKLTLPASTTLVVTWCQSIGSTMLYLFIVAILGGLIKRD